MDMKSRQSKVMATTAFVAAFAAATAAFQTNTYRSLKSQVKISEEQASAIALSRVPGGAIAHSELEKEDGQLMWEFEIEVAGATGRSEVNVDAITGEVITAKPGEREDDDDDDKDDKDDDDKNW